MTLLSAVGGPFRCVSFSRHVSITQRPKVKSGKQSCNVTWPLSATDGACFFCWPLDHVSNLQKARDTRKIAAEVISHFYWTVNSLCNDPRATLESFEWKFLNAACGLWHVGISTLLHSGTNGHDFSRVCVVYAPYFITPGKLYCELLLRFRLKVRETLNLLWVTNANKVMPVFFLF